MANAKLWQMILLAAGAGMLGRGGLGLMRMMRPQSTYEPTPSFQPVGVALPPEEEEEEKLAYDKSAEHAGAQIYNALKGTTEGLPWGKNFLFGSGASTPGTVPALWALGLPAAVLAGYGGWSVADKLLDMRRKQELSGSLDDAREDYERLLQETMPKHSADDEGIEAELDELAELATAGPEKTAALSDIGGVGVSALLSYAVLSALMSGKISYDHFKSRNRRLVAEEALKRRSKERFGGVTPIYLKPSTEIV